LRYQQQIIWRKKKWEKIKKEEEKEEAKEEKEDELTSENK
jgi:hypothetical protein